MKAFPSKIKRVLLRIAKGRLSRGEAAAALGVSERQVNRLMTSQGVRRPPSPVHAAREKAATSRARRERAAWAVIGGLASIEHEAKRAEISPRTLYRWVKRVKSSRKATKTPK